MATLSEKIRVALDEGRTLVLGAQVLLGFEFQAVFRPWFDKLPAESQYLKLVSLGCMLVALGLLMSNCAFHRIVEKGEDTRRFHGFLTGTLCVSLFPFAAGLGLDFFVAARPVWGPAPAAGAATACGVAALAFWYGLGLARRKEQRPMPEPSEPIKLHQKIEQALAETRVVIPGAQALLGFQFAAVLAEGFEKLPASSKNLHLASLALVALTTVLLMTPAAYHRLAEHGEDSEAFHRFTSRMILCAMGTLALGLCGDLFVVARKILGSAPAAGALASAALLFLGGLWFGYTLYRRAGKESAERRRAVVAPAVAAEALA